MRIAIAEFSQETDTFSPILSEVDDFKKSTCLFGSNILDKKIGRDVLDGARVFFENHKEVEILPILMAKAVPNGKLTEEAVEFFRQELITGLIPLLPIDGFLFSVHGATASVHCDDVSGLLLKTVRDIIGDNIPLVAPLDHHAVLTKRIMNTADLVVGFETQPHRPFSTGEKAAELLHYIIKTGRKPIKSWVKIPMIAPQDQFLTSQGSMKKWFDSAREIEKEESVLSVSLFPMQPWVDVEEGGWAAAVYTLEDKKLADTIACQLGNDVWNMRKDFWVSERLSPVKAIEEADAASNGLVILSDTGDAVYGGGTGDSTCIISEMLKQNISSTAFIPIVDAAAVEVCREIGLNNIELSLGGKFDPFSEPVSIQGRVTAISEGLKLQTSMGLTNLGKTVLFESGNLRIVILDSRSYAINMPILYTSLGLKIEDAKIVVLKTGSNFQYFDLWRKKLIRIDSPGTTQSNLADFTWKKLMRPIFPLDELIEWKAAVEW
ncbi:MAG: M81 family metallopeptidase [Bacteroidetes bacterium]|nr:M81 family metallopeptidase [Bacteroidota bacterium]